MVGTGVVTRGYVEIPVTTGTLEPKGIGYVVGIISVSDLVHRYQIARRESLAQTGYQRDPTTSRVNALANQLRLGHVDLPTAILVNLREFQSDEGLIHRDGRDYLRIGQNILFIVDGQHRVEALRKLYEEDPERWEGYKIPFVCLLGADELTEMEEFHVVNSNAKSVSTSLAYDLLKQRAASSPIVMEDLQASGKAWIPAAQELCEKLTDTPLWKGCIRFPRMAKASTTVNNDGMGNSLKPLFSSPFFKNLSVENQAKILGAYWEGVRRVLPDAFIDPPQYALQKRTGVAVMHDFLIDVLEYVRSKNWSVVDPESYRDTLQEPLERLSGDLPSGDIVSGAAFWKSGQGGAAGSFSSNAGRRVLVARLRQRLPKIQIS